MFTRRRFLATSTAALAAAGFGPAFAHPALRRGGPAFAFPALRRGGQQTPAPLTTAFTDIRRNVGLFTGRGGTIGWLVNPGGAIVVDSQFPDSAAACLEGILAKASKEEVAALINTHHHGDHTGGNGVFRPKTKQIIGHTNVPRYLKSGHEQAMARRAQQTPAPAAPAPAEPVPPDRTFDTSLALDHGDERIQMRHYGPAHTGGDIIIAFEKANVVHMGDLMFNRMHPVIDRVNGAAIANWAVILRRIAKELPADTIYIHGHAAPGKAVTGTRDDLLHHAGYLDALLEFVRAQVKEGKTREQVLALTDTIKGFEDYGPLIQRPLGPAFDEVSAGK